MEKFSDKFKTAKDEQRAWVSLTELKTLWFNTGTQCNLSCENCYIESSPTNDRLSYINLDEVNEYLKEISTNNYNTELIGLTGGEPFLNPHIISIIGSILENGFEVLVLTNAFRILKRHENNLMKLKELHGDKLHLRVSLDHFKKELHEGQRGENTFDKTLDSLKWLVDNGFNVSVAGRSLVGDSDPQSSYQELMKSNNIALRLIEGENLVIFPEMKFGEDVPEITTACWDILKKSPDDQMCATERMIVKRKGEVKPTVLPCTLIAYDKNFDLGNSLASSEKDVYLNHPFCAKFCVLGGASCSSAK